MLLGESLPSRVFRTIRQPCVWNARILLFRFYIPSSIAEPSSASGIMEVCVDLNLSKVPESDSEDPALPFLRIQAARSYASY